MSKLSSLVMGFSFAEIVGYSANPASLSLPKFGRGHIYICILLALLETYRDYGRPHKVAL